MGGINEITECFLLVCFSITMPFGVHAAGMGQCSVGPRNICLLAITCFLKYLFIVNLISLQGEICTSIYLGWVKFADQRLMTKL